MRPGCGTGGSRTRVPTTTRPPNGLPAHPAICARGRAPRTERSRRDDGPGAVASIRMMVSSVARSGYGAADFSLRRHLCERRLRNNLVGRAGEGNDVLVACCFLGPVFAPDGPTAAGLGGHRPRSNPSTVPSPPPTQDGREDFHTGCRREDDAPLHAPSCMVTRTGGDRQLSVERRGSTDAGAKTLRVHDRDAPTGRVNDSLSTIS